MEPEDVTDLLYCNDKTDKTSMDEKFLLMEEQKKWFLMIESIPGDDAMKITATIARDLEYYINLVGTAVAGFQRIDFNFEISFTVGKMHHKLQRSVS